MARLPTSLVIGDLSSFSRALARSLSAAAAIPGHVELQNHIARAAGYRNLQALKAAPEPALLAAPLPPAPLSANARRTLSQFDAQGRLVRWPTKFTVQKMAMWPLWTLFDDRRRYTEREVNTILRAANCFGDHVTLRRELVNHRLLARKSDCSEYWKVRTRPDDEMRTLIAAWRARQRKRAAAAPEPQPPR